MTQGPTDSPIAAPPFRLALTRMTNRLAARIPAWRRFRSRQELQLAGALWRADPALAAAWWSLLAMRGLLPAGFAISSGVLVAAVEHHQTLGVPLAVVGIVFILMQVLGPLHTALSANLGDRAAAYLYDELTGACLGPPGIGHLEDPELAADLQVARDFDRGMTAPPLSVSMDFIATGLVDMVAGLAQAAVLFGFALWAPPVLAVAWLSTHWLLRESAVWRDRNTDEVRQAQRDAEYAYRLAVDPPAAKELRIFGLPDWVLDRFVTSRRRLHQLQYQATRMRERSVLGAMLIVLAANVGVFWLLGAAALSHRIGLGPLVVYAQAAVGTSMIAFGGLNWALDGAAASVAAVGRLKAATALAGTVTSGSLSAAGMPAAQIRFRNVSFAYPAAPERLVLSGLDLDIPARSSLAIVGLNGAGKTTLAKLLCRLYDPQSGSIEVDGTDLTDLDLASWREQVTAVFQDFVRFELTLRENVIPRLAAAAAPAQPSTPGQHSPPGQYSQFDPVAAAALDASGAAGLASLDTVLAKGYTDGTDLSGGQWQRVALARAMAAVQLGAGLVLLDEPTAQLDVRGEAEIFERVLAATRSCTTILISHRFSTVRHADRIAVIEDGAVAELGSHDELMELRGRYWTMFTLQAQRFATGTPEEGEEEVIFDVLA
ncbi:MAG TPA: ATP-binding cassette domain-containing protein [Streptosporangiaceae bacterium]|jgi:ABC-type multidrug transport system fused ATPase/permease subunit